MRLLILMCALGSMVAAAFTRGPESLERLRTVGRVSPPLARPMAVQGGVATELGNNSARFEFTDLRLNFTYTPPSSMTPALLQAATLAGGNPLFTDIAQIMVFAGYPAANSVTTVDCSVSLLTAVVYSIDVTVDFGFAATDTVPDPRLLARDVPPFAFNDLKLYAPLLVAWFQSNGLGTFAAADVSVWPGGVMTSPFPGIAVSSRLVSAADIGAPMRPLAPNSVRLSMTEYSLTAGTRPWNAIMPFVYAQLLLKDGAAAWMFSVLGQLALGTSDAASPRATVSAVDITECAGCGGFNFSYTLSLDVDYLYPTTQTFLPRPSQLLPAWQTAFMPPNFNTFYPSAAAFMRNISFNFQTTDNVAFIVDFVQSSAWASGASAASGGTNPDGTLPSPTTPLVMRVSFQATAAIDSNRSAAGVVAVNDLLVNSTIAALNSTHNAVLPQWLMPSVNVTYMSLIQHEASNATAGALDTYTVGAVVDLGYNSSAAAAAAQAAIPALIANGASNSIANSTFNTTIDTVLHSSGYSDVSRVSGSRVGDVTVIPAPATTPTPSTTATATGTATGTATSTSSSTATGTSTSTSTSTGTMSSTSTGTTTGTPTMTSTATATGTSTGTSSATSSIAVSGTPSPTSNSTGAAAATGDDPLSPGAVAGISVAAIIVGLIVIGVAAQQVLNPRAGGGSSSGASNKDMKLSAAVMIGSAAGGASSAMAVEESGSAASGDHHQPVSYEPLPAGPEHAQAAAAAKASLKVRVPRTVQITTQA